jgi:thiol-disulfide isomerase/thioredoxin
MISRRTILQKHQSRLILVILLLLSPFLLIAMTTKIQGKAPGFKGEHIRYLGFGDYISNTEFVIAESVVDSSGIFSLSFETKDTIYGNLEIGYQFTGMFTCPGAVYQLAINSNSISRLSNPINPFFEKAALNITILNADSMELNTAVSSFLTLLDTSLLQNPTKINLGAYKRSYDSLVKVLEHRFPGAGSGFFARFMEYKLASFDGLVHRSTETQAAVKYFSGTRVMYSNPAYMEYFNLFFEGYLTRYSKNLPKRDILYCVNTIVSFAALTDSAGKDPILRNEELRELVLLKGLSEIYYNKAYNKSGVLALLRQAEKSKFKEHQEISRNLQKKLQHMQTGTVMPDFSLRDVSGKIFTKDDFKGKLLYISFVTSWCETCMRELIFMEKLHEKFKSKVSFVTIFCNDDRAYLAGFLGSHKTWDWTFLGLESDASLLKTYDIKAFPEFILCDQRGDVLNYPARRPSQGIEMDLNRILGWK